MTRPHSQVAEDWERLARAVRQRRSELHLSAADVQARGGPSIAVVSKIETTRQTAYRPSSLADLERALDWKPNSVMAILLGGDPTPIEEDVARTRVAAVEYDDFTATHLLLSDGSEVVAMTRKNEGPLTEAQQAAIAAFFGVRPRRA